MEVMTRTVDLQVKGTPRKATSVSPHPRPHIPLVCRKDGRTSAFPSLLGHMSEEDYR